MAHFRNRFGTTSGSMGQINSSATQTMAIVTARLTKRACVQPPTAPRTGRSLDPHRHSKCPQHPRPPPDRSGDQRDRRVRPVQAAHDAAIWKYGLVVARHIDVGAGCHNCLILRQCRQIRQFSNFADRPSTAAKQDLAHGWQGPLSDQRGGISDQRSPTIKSVISSVGLPSHPWEHPEFP